MGKNQQDHLKIGVTQKLEVAVRLGRAQEMFGIVDPKIYIRRTDGKIVCGLQDPEASGSPHGG